MIDFGCGLGVCDLGFVDRGPGLSGSWPWPLKVVALTPVALVTSLNQLHDKNENSLTAS